MWEVHIYERLFSCLTLLVSILAITTFPPELYAGQEPSAFSVRWENDALSGTDANYTNGMSLALTRTGGGILGGVWDLFDDSAGRRFATYELGQLQFTPTDLNRSDPDPTDRPYAGFLYLGLTTYLKRPESLHGVKLFVGVVGPFSQSEAAQEVAHHILGYKKPQGWSSQLKNEPIVNLLYEYRHKFTLTPSDSSIGVDLIPMGGAMLGNFLIQAQVDAQLRIGYHLPDDFGTTSLRGIGYLPFPEDEVKQHGWGVYVFAGGGANLVARNITLDGNSFANSRSVDRRLFLPATELGASFWTRRFQTTFSYVMWGKEFSGQQESEDFGSVLFTYIFR
jgi:lipid A 3-O-deacylase